MKGTLALLLLILTGCGSLPENNERETTAPAKPEFPFTARYVNCMESALSEQFSIKFRNFRFKVKDETNELSNLVVYVHDKETEALKDSIEMSARNYYSNMFWACDSLTSFSTGFHSDRNTTDNFYGDIVVADFNFDNLDDVAIISDSGGNGGPAYSFYIQKKNLRFERDSFLSDSVVYFPKEINKKNRSLRTLVHANARSMQETWFSLDKSGNWKRKGSKLVSG